MEPVSPELVLVDPILAERSRSRLADPDDTLARVGALVQTSRMASLARRSTDMPWGSISDLAEPTRRISRTRQRRTAVLAGTMAAGSLVFALLVGVRVDLGGNPAGADTTVITTVIDQVPAPSVPSTPKARAETRPKASRPPRATNPATNPAPQRFAWAPTPSASAYHVELFRGSSKVFEGETKRPAMTIPSRWTFDQRRHSLEPGNYRWYVWPLVSGRRAATAIVQAKLTVPAP